MNRRKAILTGLTVLAPAARAAAKDSEVFLDRWEKAKTFTLQVADAMPAEAYDFRPKPEMRNYGEEMQHIGTNNVFYISRFQGGKSPDSLPAPKVFDKETTKAYLVACFDYCAEVLKGITDAELDQSYPGRPNTAPQTGWDWVLHAFIHTAHHRGYAEVYLREKGIVPPHYAV
ncbi:MAG TPA: DinB family protein [Bryobacteraceae bacterium]|nr:DinB family protein [Bryobacteraceae bacterium]